MANPFAQANNTVGSLAAGHIVLASEWNAAVGGIYTYINSTLLAGGLNKLSNKGDLYVFDGTNLQAIAAGANGQMLQADSAQPAGLKWNAVATLTTLTTTGDLLYYNAGNQRLGIGATGQVLTVSGGLPAWGTAPGAIPLGGIIIWDLSKRAMPTGFNLCDGGTYSGFVTPNTQGLFVVGAGLSNNGPAASGMGIVAAGTIAGDVSAGTGLGPAHVHQEVATITSSGASGIQQGSWIDSSPVYTSSTTVTPRYIALNLIMRTS